MFPTLIVPGSLYWKIDGVDDTSYWCFGSSDQGSWYPPPVRFMTRLQQGVAVSGLLCRVPHAVHIHWVREWLSLNEGGLILGVSLSMVNGDIFNDDDLPVDYGSVLDGHYGITLSYGRKRVSFYCISVILDLYPYGPQYTLLLTKCHAFLRTNEGAGDEEYKYTDDSSTEDDSSDDNYSLSDDE